LCFFFQAEDGIRDFHVTGVQTCALPIWENTEDIYTGIEFPAESADGNRVKEFLANDMAVDFDFTADTAIGIKTVSEHGSKRLIRAAIEYAIRQGVPSVTLVHKGNIMKYTEGAFKYWG